MVVSDFLGAAKSLSFLDNLNSALEYPHIFVDMRKDDLQPIYRYYGKLSSKTPHSQGEPNICAIANHLCGYLDHDEITNEILEKELELWKEEHPKAINFSKSIDKTVLEGNLFLRTMLYDFVSILNYGIGIRELFDKVRGGDHVAFVYLLRIDKTIITTKYGQPFILQAQYQADWEYLQSVGEAIAAEPLAVQAEIPKAVILVAKFWDELFSEMKFREIVAYLKKYDALPNVNDYGYFRKQLYKFGLKKTRYNKK